MVTQRIREDELAQIVVKRVFIAPLKRLLNATILPHVFKGAQVLDRYGLKGVEVSLFHDNREVGLYNGGFSI